MNTFTDPLNRAIQIARNDEAVADRETRYSYGELAARCARLVGGLYGLGLQGGDRVAILAANSHPYLEAYLAVPAGQLVIVPLDRKSTRLNSSHVKISYAVFCLKKKKKNTYKKMIIKTNLTTQ